ncbi:MAG: hypothetical protein A2010_11965 [Nitrospirae bacterium GWD2_57_9]|nr:MAG: hypothetical protein A2010_11965 [Nitrospirae bacterium GWD2_57_9]
MKKQKLSKLFTYLGLCCALVFAVALLNGCGEGDSGAAGPAGDRGEDGTNAPVTITGTQAKITLATAATSTVVGTVVEFQVTNQDGQPVTSLPDGIGINFTYAKLLSDSAGNTQWKSYINSTATGKTEDSDGNTITPALASATQATYQTATDAIENLGGGKYRYTFTNSKVTNVTYEPSLTHRIGMQMSGGGLAPVNAVYDFVPAGGAVSATRKIATTSSCLDCHQGNFGLHGGSRVEVEYCVTCHNPGTTDPESGNTVDMATMIHKIHAGEHLPSVKGADGIHGTADDGSYAIYGYNVTKHDYSEVRYPQSLRNCTKCHKSSTTTPNGNNWKTNPTRAACGGCHDDLIVSAGTLSHVGGVYTNDLGCSSVLCHGSTAPYAVDKVHTTVLSTPNNPGTPAGVAAFEYIISSVTVTNGQPEFKFQIKKDGSLVTFNTDTTGAMLTGFTSGPSLYVAFARPQDGKEPVDFNNNMSSALSVSLVSLWTGSNGVFSGPVSGTYTALITVPTMSVQSDAKMVTGAMIGSFSQTGVTEATLDQDVNRDGDKLDAYNNVALAAVKTATGYTARRTIVDNAKCNACHEQLGTEPYFHSGARNNAQLCEFCHTPNRNSSGWSAKTKDFVHRLHAAGVRTVDDVWHDMDYYLVAYPGNLQNCEACHVEGSYDFSGSAYTASLIDNLPLSTAASGTIATGTTAASPYITFDQFYGAGGASTNLVNSPISSACFGCHDRNAAVAHMNDNGGSIYEVRSDALNKVEQCLICHGPGRSAAIGAAHDPNQAVGH